MFISICMIILVWAIKIPLWASIAITVLSALRILASIFRAVIKWFRWVSINDGDEGV